MNSKIIALIAVAVIVIGGWLVYKQNGGKANLQDLAPAQNINQGSSSPAPVSSTPVPANTSTAASTVKEFTVNGSSFSFSPNTLTVNKGDTVKINFVNSGGTHDFVIDEFSVKTPQISGGQSASVTFVASKAGTFEYYCSVGTHRQMGMRGTLTVK